MFFLQNILLNPEVAKLVPNLKHRPTGTVRLLYTITWFFTKYRFFQGSPIQQGNQTNLNSTNGTRVPASGGSVAVSAATSKPIRDPRLLRQQQQKHTDSNLNVQLGQRTANLDNKNVSNKTGVRKIRNDPRLVVNKNHIPSPKSSDTTLKQSTLDTTTATFIPKVHSGKSQKSSRIIAKSNSDLNSNKSSVGLSKSESPSKSKSVKNHSSPSKYKKSKEKNFLEANSNNNSNKKLSPKETRDRSDKSDINQSNSTFKDVKISTKNRNYVRRNLPSVSPEPAQDEDLRAFGPPEKQPRLQSDAIEQSKIFIHIFFFIFLPTASSM